MSTSLPDGAFYVDDPGDPRLVPYRDLKDPSLRRRTEAAQGFFVAEGKLAVRAVLGSPFPLLSVLVLRRRAAVLSELDLPPGVAVFIVEDNVMSAVAGFDVHRGVLGLAARLALPSPSGLLASAGLSPVVVVEGVNDQENLGAIFRNAAAFGAGAVLVDPTCADPLYRRTVRVSLGLVLRVPFTRLSPWPAALALVADSGFALVALTPSPSAERLGSVAEELQGQKVALVVGAEGPGLSAAVLGMCRPVRIAMAPGVDSLNVAAATAVALHRFALVR
jgi:tRNA G18 (ribose-2'-O)-methylase SpoU